MCYLEVNFVVYMAFVLTYNFVFIFLSHALNFGVNKNLIFDTPEDIMKWEKENVTLKIEL